jgi:ketosteroid isomerase-like protein
MSSDVSALLALEARRVRAMNEADPDAMLALLQDDHVHVMANGVVTDKRGASEGVRNVRRVVEPREPLIRMYGDIAILTGPQVNNEHINGEPVRVELFVTRVARRTSDGWKFVSMHATRLPA